MKGQTQELEVASVFFNIYAKESNTKTYYTQRYMHVENEEALILKDIQMKVLDKLNSFTI